MFMWSNWKIVGDNGGMKIFFDWFIYFFYKINVDLIYNLRV